MSTPSRMEFAVQMTCNSCVDSIKHSFQGIEGVHEVEINLPQEQVIVTSILPSSKVIELLESTGRRAVLKGQGSSLSSKHLGAAVCMLETGEPVKGVVRWLQADEDTCIIEGTIDGLSSGKHSVSIHEYGDITRGCASCGDVFDAPRMLHGQSSALEKATGDLGVIDAGENGRSRFRMESQQLKVWDIIGRSLVVGSSGEHGGGTACGIIARSAGLFENTKQICACDGVTLWDERDVPIAGKERSQFTQSKSSQL